MIGIIIWLQLTFLGLKVAHLVDWSWWLVALPALGATVSLLFIYGVVLADAREV